MRYGMAAISKRIINMHLEVLAEDKSGSIFLEGLLDKVLADNNISCSLAVRPHRGKGFYPQNPWDRPKKFASGLLDLLPAKLRAYSKVFVPGDLILLIVLDADEEEPLEVKKEVRNIAVKFGGEIPYVIGISVEEIEAWMLGDLQAVKTAYPDARIQAAANYVQDSICGTWEVLARVILGTDAERLIRVGYPAIGQYKSEWAARIAPHIRAGKNRSPSFQEFYSLLMRSLKRGRIK